MCRRNYNKHGQSKTRLYGIWAGIKTRCFNKKHSDYHLYGGRGIKIFAEWLVFENFKEWAMENGYRDNLEIDRIDNDGNYSPDNCRWVSRKEQTRNTKKNRYFVIDGQKKCISEWCKIYKISHQLFLNRLSKGWDIKTALTKPIKNMGNKKT